MSKTKSRLTAPPPPPSRVGAPPTPSEIRRNLNEPSSGLKDFSFKLPPEFHREFKIRAAMDGLTMTELFRRSFEAYKRQQNQDP